MSSPEQTSHRSLFQQYVKDLEQARIAAEAWWRDVLAAERARDPAGDPEKPVRMRWPFGPASHPYVLAVYRKYYIACLDLNNQLENKARDLRPSEGLNGARDEDWGVETNSEGELERPVPPAVFTTDWLFGEYNDLRLFVADMVFLPVGIEDMRR